MKNIFFDQPQIGMNKVIWWCEYVIRHKGAKHLRSPSADIALYEYLLLDMILVVVISIYLSSKILQLVMKFINVLVRKSSFPSATKSKKKN